jgi:hypothetical protein
MKHNCRSLLGFDQSTYSLESLCQLQKIRKKYYQEDQTGRKKNRFQTTTRSLMKRDAAHMDCKFLKSPMAGEISPPRFKLDRLLHRTHNGKILKPKFAKQCERPK